MLVYRPSLGNNSVSLNSNGEWTGFSIGGEVIERVKFGPTDYFLWAYPSITNNSEWFFNPFTDIDFIKGSTTYRCLYIGPDEKSTLPEIIGNLSVSIESDLDISDPNKTIADNAVSISIWHEGDFNYLQSKNSILLDTETDSTSALPLSAIFSTSISLSADILPTYYSKIWIKITTSPQVSLVGEKFNYNISFGNIQVTVPKDKARLSLSNVYVADLSSNDKNILNSLIPKDFQYNESIQKVIFKNDLFHVFYIDNGALKDLIVHYNEINSANKYVEIDLSSLASDITSTVAFTEIMTGNTILGMNTVCTSGVSEVKQLVNIFPSIYEDSNGFYLFYNNLKLSTDEDYELKYGHQKYQWYSNVIYIDLSAFNKDFFQDITSGFDNRMLTYNYIGHDMVLKSNFFNVNTIKQEDFFTLCGFYTTNESDKNYYTVLGHIFESDIIKNKNDLQINLIPTGEFNNIISIQNMSDNDNALIISDITSVNKDLSHHQREYQLSDGTKYIDLGSPNLKKIIHLKDTTFHVEMSDTVDEWSSIVSMRISVDSTDVTGYESYNDENAIHRHLLYTEDITSSVAMSNIYPSVCISGCNLTLFEIKTYELEDSCLSISYDFDDNVFMVSGVDVSGNITSQNITGHKFILGQDNVFGFNIQRIQVFDSQCNIKYFVSGQVTFNGNLLTNVNTYTLNSIDNLILLYNPEKSFEGSISYWEVGTYKDNFIGYSKSMYDIHSNIMWSYIGKEIISSSFNENLQHFKYKRNIKLKNLTSYNDTIIVPITLQGNYYNLTNYEDENFDIRDWRDELNWEVLRINDTSTAKNNSVFNFSTIDLNNKIFAFTKNGSDDLLPYYVEQYNHEADKLTIWVKLNSINDDNLVMYYGNMKIENKQLLLNPFEDNYGTWIMNSFENIQIKKYNYSALFESGESFMYLKKGDNKFLIEIKYPYMIGNKAIFKSDKVNIVYDDRDIDVSEIDTIETFIRDTCQYFIPANKSINKVQSRYNYILESSNREKENNE